jgi:hypothetical protein
LNGSGFECTGKLEALHKVGLILVKLILECLKIDLHHITNSIERLLHNSALSRELLRELFRKILDNILILIGQVLTYILIKDDEIGYLTHLNLHNFCTVI